MSYRKEKNYLLKVFYIKSNSSFQMRSLREVETSLIVLIKKTHQGSLINNHNSMTFFVITGEIEEIN